MIAMEALPSCPASRRPVQHLLPGDGTDCPSCGRRVRLTPPPWETLLDPWRPSLDARIPLHWNSDPAIDVSW